MLRQSNLPVIILAILWLQAGCTRTTPVAEVSVETSGVAVDQDEFPSRLTRQWHSWRGPDNNGIADGAANLPTTWNADTITWQADVPGRGHSSPVVVNNRVFLTTADDAEQTQSLLAYDFETGEQAWSKVVHQGNFPSPGEIHHKATNANSTVACDGERVYCVFFNGGKISATAYDVKGERKWQKELGAFNSKFGYAPSPILYRSLVIIAADNRGGGYLVALDGASGKIAWRVKRRAVSTYSSPVVAHVQGRDQLLISGGNAISSYDPVNGEQNWETSCLSEATCGTLVTDGVHVIGSGGYPESETIALNANGKKVWSDRTKLYEPSLVCAGDLLFGVTDRGIAHCWESDTGKKMWTKRLRGSFSASPVVASGKVFVPNLSGQTFVFEATGDEFKEVAVNTLGDDCYASPAIIQGRILLRVGFGRGPSRREKLVCIAPPVEKPEEKSSE